jgi:hypothetical protein
MCLLIHDSVFPFSPLYASSGPHHFAGFNPSIAFFSFPPPGIRETKKIPRHACPRIRLTHRLMQMQDSASLSFLR